MADRNKIGIINGPNLNLLGKREPEVYGSVSFEEYLDSIRKKFPDLEFLYYQSNVEGELINALHEFSSVCSGIVINPGGYSHTSVSIADAIAAIPVPVIEVHISHVFKREEFRRQLITAPACKGFICGLGLESYMLAIRYLMEESR
jgi:3-dehydroquinate dehydratase-2